MGNEVVLKRKREKHEWNWFYIVLAVVLFTYVLALFIPMIWAVITSFKHPYEYEGLFDPIFQGNKLGLPNEWTLFNYKIGSDSAYFYGRITMAGDAYGEHVGLFTSENVSQSLFVNSILYAVGSAVAATIVPCFTAYIVARFNYKFSKVIYAVVILVMALPIVGSLPSEIQVAEQLHFRNTFYGIWLMKANFLGLYFLVFFAQFKSIPMTYSEAANVDGASNFRIMFQIIMPMAVGTMFTVFLLNFVLFWNDYQTPMNYLQNHPVLANGMIQFFQSNDNITGEAMTINKTPIKLAGTLFAALPIILVALIGSRRLTANISVGGIKE